MYDSIRGIKGTECEKIKLCKLNKAMYVLKQAAGCWFERFENTVTEKRFQNSLVDLCINVLDRKDNSKNINVVLYIGDLVILTSNIDTVQSFKNYLLNQF